jgi:hypothetical protein
MVRPRRTDHFADEGLWHSSYYQSGTVNVESRDPNERRWLWIGYPRTTGQHEGDVYLERQKVAGQLAGWLNDGTRPDWLDDVELVSDSKVCRKSDGLEIRACGPVYESEPGSGDWHEEDDDADLRDKLIFFTFLNPSESA